MKLNLETSIPRDILGQCYLAFSCKVFEHFFFFVSKILWRREWLPTPVFLPGESSGERSLVGYSPRGCRVSHQ